MSSIDPQIPPRGEDIHLPGPSIQPVLLTVGITLALVGVTVSTILIVIGGILTLAVLIRWIRDARHEFNELPLDHGH